MLFLYPLLKTAGHQAGLNRNRCKCFWLLLRNMSLSLADSGSGNCAIVYFPIVSNDSISSLLGRNVTPHELMKNI